MSVESVTARINQILQMQQQLFDPQSAASASAAGVGATASADAAASVVPASSPAGGSLTFSQMLASAQGATGASAVGGVDASGGVGAVGGLGSTLPAGLTTPTAGLTTPTTTLSTGDAAGKVQAMVNMANSLVGKPYVWGGGHGGWGPQSGYDCSGFVSAVLHAGGYLSAPADTTSMPNQPGIEAGPGQYVTIYDRAQPGENGHVIIKINGQFYESGGSAGAWGGGGGVEKIGTPSASYLASFPNVLHPAGL
jgi:cell wall-associated NlpC family hydrolase